jgi:hypothetical protein
MAATPSASIAQRAWRARANPNGLSVYGYCDRTPDRVKGTWAGVYAAGDVTGKDQFVYMAAYGAKLAAKNALDEDLVWQTLEPVRPTVQQPRTCSHSAGEGVACRGPGDGRPVRAENSGSDLDCRFGNRMLIGIHGSTPSKVVLW